MAPLSWKPRTSTAPWSAATRCSLRPKNGARPKPSWLLRRFCRKPSCLPCPILKRMNLVYRILKMFLQASELTSTATTLCERCRNAADADPDCPECDELYRSQQW